MTIIFLILFIPWVYITIIGILAAIENIHGYETLNEDIEHDKFKEEKARRYHDNSKNI